MCHENTRKCLNFGYVLSFTDKKLKFAEVGHTARIHSQSMAQEGPEFGGNAS